jgi:hypothetical protein
MIQRSRGWRFARRYVIALPSISGLLIGNRDAQV